MKKILIITMLVAVSVLKAQTTGESHAFSLQDAISYALQHNYSAINAGRDIDIAKQKKRETTATGLPQINATGDYVDNFKLQQSVIPAEFFGGPPGTFTEIAFGTKHTLGARATLSQLIFDGSYIVALQASKTYLKYYQNAKSKSNSDIREMVINAYGNVLLAQESIAILNKNKETLDKTLHDTRETYNNGLIEEENVEQLEITLASVNSNLNNTNRLLDIAYKNLKVTLGLDINANLTLTDNLDALTLSNLDMSFSQSDFNVSNNIDYQIAQNFEQQKMLEYKLQRSKALPTLSANVNYGVNSFSNSFTFTHEDQRYFNYSSLGVSLNVPIFSSFARTARTQQARIAHEESKTLLTETEQKLKLAYEKAKSDYQFSVEEFETQKNNLKLAERIENKQQVKFTEGLSSSFDFSEAQRQLYTAQQDYLQSMINIVNNRAALEKIINSK